jgi:AbiU2
MSISPAAVGEMVERVVELSRSYAIWWELKKKPNAKRYAPLFQGHQDFFGAIIHSLLQGFCVIAYQLFEKRNDTKSIRSLLDELSHSNSVLASQLRAQIDAQKPLLGKVFSIRGNVYAHRNKAQTPHATFVAARLTPKEMKAVVHLAQNMVANLADAAGLGSKADVKRDIRRRQAFAILDTREIMRVLTSAKD